MLNNSGSNAQINDFGGSHTISAPIAVAGNNNLDVTVTSAVRHVHPQRRNHLNSGMLQNSGSGNLVISGESCCRHRPEFRLGRQSDDQRWAQCRHTDTKQHLGAVDRQSAGRLLGKHRNRQRCVRNDHRAGGDPTSTTAIANTFNTAGQTVKFQGGTWNLNGGGGYQIESGNGQRNGDRGWPQFHRRRLLPDPIADGPRRDTFVFEHLRHTNGQHYGANNATGINFTGLQDGGLVSVANNNSNNGSNGPQLGSSTNGITASYTLSGGTFSTSGGIGFALGAGTLGTGMTTLTLAGSGLLSVSGNISGSQGAGARQVFNFSGGTLVAAGINATLLSGTAAPAVQGTFYNNGGILAPGGIGTAGKTTITGNYSVTSANAALAIDLGGATQATAFQNPGAHYDTVNVNNGSASLGSGSRLLVTLTNGFAASIANSNTFDILNSTGTGLGLSGGFANTFTGKNGETRVLASDGISTLLLAINTTGAAATVDGLANVPAYTVCMGGFLTNQWSAASGSNWSPAASWTVATPNSSAYVAQFADAPIATGPQSVDLDAPTTVQGLIFNSTLRSYTISGSNTLTLDNTATPPRPRSTCRPASTLSRRRLP